MSTERAEVDKDLCPQCYGRTWVSIRGRKITCTCVATKTFDSTSESRDRARRR